MKALGSKNFLSAGKVVLKTLWEMRMTDLYDKKKKKDKTKKALHFSFRKNSSDTAAAVTDLKIRECNIQDSQTE